MRRPDLGEGKSPSARSARTLSYLSAGLKLLSGFTEDDGQNLDLESVDGSGSQLRQGINRVAKIK